MQSIPEHFVHTKATPFWDKNTVPEALLSHHNTKAGVYGRLSVMQGAITYFGFADENATIPDITLTVHAGEFAVSPPQKWHRIELIGDDTYFNIDFFADPAATAKGIEGVKVVHLPEGAVR